MGPEAVLVFDHFHVVKLMNDKLTKLRRALQDKAAAEEKEVLKGTRWLLVKNPGRLNEERDEGKAPEGGSRSQRSPGSGPTI